MIVSYYKTNTVESLPENWDQISLHYFQSKEFLYHCELYNPCEQRYYYGLKNNTLVCGAVVYTLSLDLFTFAGLKSPLRMHIIGIPCSVSCDGYIGDTIFFDKLNNFIISHEKGLLITLNLASASSKTNHIHGHTFPTIIFRNTYSNWNGYIQALTSNYRRRLKNIQFKGRDLIFIKQSCKDFTPQMHELYLSVFYKSKGKLEKLSFSFFKNLPKTFQLTTVSMGKNVIGWYITVRKKGVLYFFLGGIDYHNNRQNATYLNVLFAIIKDGITANVELVDLGQTAEIPKMRTGANIEQRYITGFHSNKILNTCLKLCKNLLVYKPTIPPAHPFRKNL